MSAKTNTKIHGYKYTIYDRLRKLPYEEYEVAMTFLPEQIGITKGTFRNWIYLKADEKTELPSGAILKLATFFECEPIDLFAYPFDAQKFAENWNEAKAINNQSNLNFQS